jgi:hypothetical protein
VTTTLLLPASCDVGNPPTPPSTPPACPGVASSIQASATLRDFVMTVTLEAPTVDGARFSRPIRVKPLYEGVTISNDYFDGTGALVVEMNLVLTRSATLVVGVECAAGEGAVYVDSDGSGTSPPKIVLEDGSSDAFPH